MSRGNACFVTFDDAVARMINFDYIPEGFSLLDMTSAFKEEAQVNLENAEIDQASTETTDKLREHLEVCSARHHLAEALLERLALESNDPDSSLEFDRGSDTLTRVSMERLFAWAGDTFAIGIPHQRENWDDTAFAVGVPRPQENQEPQADWEHVTIKIQADLRLVWRVGEGPYVRSSFLAIDLLDKRTRESDFQGVILIGLAMGRKFPTENLQGKHKAAISRLRAALRRLTGISADPFRKYNPADGWRPRFQLIDDRRNAEERAKNQAQHVPYDDTRDYQAEDDEAGEWLEQNK